MKNCIDYPLNLYKYQGFKKYTKAILSSGEIYLCPENELDDIKEGVLDIPQSVMDSKPQSYVETILPFLLDRINYVKGNKKTDKSIELSLYKNLYNNNKLNKVLFKKY